jgi:hypothetical protein
VSEAQGALRVPCLPCDEGQSAVTVYLLAMTAPLNGPSSHSGPLMAALLFTDRHVASPLSPGLAQ